MLLRDGPGQHHRLHPRRAQVHASHIDANRERRKAILRRHLEPSVLERRRASTRRSPATSEGYNGSKGRHELWKVLLAFWKIRRTPRDGFQSQIDETGAEDDAGLLPDHHAVHADGIWFRCQEAEAEVKERTASDRRRVRHVRSLCERLPCLPRRGR